jgi:hypothetical protein
LKNEGKADKEKKSQCLEEYQQTTRGLNKLDWKIKNNVAQIAKFDKLLEMRRSEKESTIQKIDETKQYMKDAMAERKQEHEAFQKTKKDDETAIGVLTKAQTTMAKYYNENQINMGPIQGSVKLVQVDEPVFDRGDQALGAKFSGKDAHEGEAKGILSMFAYIIEDLHDEILEARKAESQSQKEYEAEMDTAQKLFEDLKAQKTTLEGIVAKRLEQKEEENKDMKGNNKDRDATFTYKAQIKPDCDWMLKNFDKRVEAREAEMAGLVSAKEFLSGQQALVQIPRKLSTRKESNLGFLHMH